MTNPMTELDVAQSLQSQIAGLELGHPHAREYCLGLISSLERSLDRIKAVEYEMGFQESMKEMDRSILRINQLGQEIVASDALLRLAEHISAVRKDGAA
jgi:hypothetical protein